MTLEDQIRDAKNGLYTRVFGQTMDHGHAIFYTHCPIGCVPIEGETLPGPLSEAVVQKRRTEM